MSLGNINNQSLNTFIKEAEKPKEKTPAQEAPATGGAQERDDNQKLEESGQVIEVHKSDETQQKQGEKLEGNKKLFEGNKSQEEVKTTHQSLRENVDKVMDRAEVKPEKVEQQSFEHLAKGLEKIEENKDKKTDETKKEDTKPENMKIGNSFSDTPSTESKVLLGKEPEVTEKGGAKDRDDNEMQDKSNKAIEHSSEKHHSVENQHHEHEQIHVHHEKVHHASIHMAEKQIEQQLEKEEEAKKKVNESSAHVLAHEEDPNIIKEASKSQSGGGAQNEQSEGGESTSEMLQKMKELENEEDNSQAEMGHEILKHAEKETVKEIAKEHGIEKKEPKEPMQGLEAAGRVVKGGDNTSNEDSGGSEKLQEILKLAKESENAEDEVYADLNHDSQEISQEETLRHQAKEKVKEATTEVKPPEDLAAMFKVLITKMPDTEMSQDDKQRSSSEIESLIHSSKFKGFSPDLQNSMLSFIDGSGAQRGIFQKVETGNVESSKKLELGGPLAGVTMNIEKSVNKGGVVTQVNDISLKASTNVEASVRIMTQTMPSGTSHLVGDQLFGSAVEMKIKPGTTGEQFKSTIESTVNKLVMAFSENSGTAHIDRAQLKSALESAFNKIADNLDKTLSLGPQNSPVTVKVPLNEIQGSISTGNAMVEIQPRLTLV